MEGGWEITNVPPVNVYMWKEKEVFEDFLSRFRGLNKSQTNFKKEQLRFPEFFPLETYM